MGKRSRQKMSGQTEDKTPGWLATKWQNMKDNVNDKVDNALNQAQVKAIEKYKPRFMELSGCNHPNLIHWDDPQISLECKLCDIRNLKLIRHGRDRDKFLAILSDEERDIYLNFVGYDGKKYTDLEDGNLMVELIKGIKQRWKESRKKGELTAEEEKELDTALDDLLND